MHIFSRFFSRGKNDDFTQARIKLTFWYTLIISCILIIFTLIVYTIIKERYLNMLVSNFTLTQKEAQEKARLLHSGEILEVEEEVKNGLREISVEFADGESIDFSPLYQEGKIDSTKTREADFIESIEESLIALNCLILFITSLLAYILAGKTLDPIQDKIKREERFIQDVAHELRNPLSCIKITCQGELKKGEFLTWKEVLEETERLISVSEGLMTLSQETFGKKESISLKKVMEHVLRILTPFAGEKKMSFEVHLSNYSIVANTRELEKVIFNIIHNALKFSKENGKIIIQLKKNGTLSIRDFGCGIGSQELPHVFERFYKADSSRDFQNGGSGLGLSIVKNILDGMQAKIEITSTLGEGTTCTIKF